MIATAAVLLAGASFPASSVASDRGKTAGDRGKTAGKASFIDQLLEAAWKQAGAKPAKPASDEEFLRRAYLDLLGRIPNVQEARAFLHDQGAGQAGEAGRVPARAPRLSQELRAPSGRSC